MQYEWSNYEASARAILNNSDYGFFIVAEAGLSIVGFIALTYEWSDWRNSAFFYLQGMQVEGDAEVIIPVLKAGIETHKATFDFTCSGIRFYNPKAVHNEAVQII